MKPARAGRRALTVLCWFGAVTALVVTGLAAHRYHRAEEARAARASSALCPPQAARSDPDPLASIAAAHPDDAPGAPNFVIDKSDPASLPPFAEPLEPAPPREPTPPPAPVRGPRPSHEQGALAVAKGVAVKHSFAPTVQPGAVAMWPRSTLSFVVAQHTLRDRARHWLVEVGAEGTVLRTASWSEPL